MITHSTVFGWMSLIPPVQLGSKIGMVEKIPNAKPSAIPQEELLLIEKSKLTFQSQSRGSGLGQTAPPI